MKMTYRINQLVAYIILMTLSLQYADAQEEKKEIFVDVQFIPVGTIPPLRYGTVKGKFMVLGEPADTKPPEIYYKAKKQYIRLGCNLNCLAVAVRIPVALEQKSEGSEKPPLITKELKFYTRTEGKKKEVTYHPIHTHNWTSDEKRLLFVLTKPMETPKWTTPKVTGYNLTPALAKKSGLVVINASQKQKIGFKANSEKGALSSHGIKSFSGDENGINLTLVTSSNGKILLPYRKAFHMSEDRVSLVLTYPVSVKKNKRGLDVVRKSLILGKYRKPTYVKDK